MKFKTKLAITFLTIILLPVLLSLCAFLGIGTVMMRSGGQTTYGEGMRAYSMMSESIDAFSQATDELFDTIQEQARENTHRLEDKAYLDKLNEEAADKSSYIIIRKGDRKCSCRAADFFQVAGVWVGERGNGFRILL